MMKVSFAEVDEAYIRNKVDDGYYSSVAEVIRDAVRRLRESEHNNRLRAALEDGERAVRDGRYSPLTRELFDEITDKAIEKAKNSEKIIRPDVTPY